MTRKHSFTLLEILIAIGVVVILAGITMGGLRYASARSDEARTQAVMKEFEMALQKFKSDHGVFPVWTNDDVNKGVKFKGENKWNRFCDGGYLSGRAPDILNDGYGNPLFYRYPGTKNPKGYDLWSLGPDGKHGSSTSTGYGDITKAGETGSDDICNWRSNN